LGRTGGRAGPLDRPMRAWSLGRNRICDGESTACPNPGHDPNAIGLTRARQQVQSQRRLLGYRRSPPPPLEQTIRSPLDRTISWEAPAACPAWRSRGTSSCALRGDGHGISRVLAFAVVDLEQLERVLRERLDALGPAPARSSARPDCFPTSTAPTASVSSTGTPRRVRSPSS
jgi:hypothetical protein